MLYPLSYEGGVCRREGIAHPLACSGSFGGTAPGPSHRRQCSGLAVVGEAGLRSLEGTGAEGTGSVGKEPARS